MVDAATAETLARYAERYETAGFLEGDPSMFMHLAEGDADREATAFVASALSFGSRPQFMAKIRLLADAAEGGMDAWIRSGAWESTFAPDDGRCFYRFFTRGDMRSFFAAYRRVMDSCGSLGECVRRESGGDGLEAVRAVCRAFSGGGGVVPGDAKSACKRVCMFLRWMSRSGSPVDLGLWADFMDRRTLAMPLDTHVVRQARRLGLLASGSASMCAALRLSAAMREVFPDDPLRGDFALFGYGVNHGREGK